MRRKETKIERGKIEYGKEKSDKLGEKDRQGEKGG